MKYISVSEYAKMKGISRQAVIQRIRRGYLKAERVGSVFIISSDEAAKDIPRKPSRPTVYIAHPPLKRK